MDTKAALARIKELADQKRYAEVRALLEKLDHPMRDSWLTKMDALIAKEKRQATISGTASKSSTAEQRAASPTPQPARHETSVSQKPVSGTAKSRRNPFPDSAIIGGLLAIAIVGIGGGLLLFLSGKIAYMIFFSPLIAGLLLGLLMAEIMKFLKVRQPYAAAVFGVLMGLVAYATFRYAEYVDFSTSFRSDITAEYGEYEPGEIDAFINQLLQAETGQTGFIGFVMLEAQHGMTVRDGPISGDTWSTGATLLYWLAERIILMGFPAYFVFRATNEPFCEDTNEWLRFHTVAGIAMQHRSIFLRLIKEGKIAEAAELIKSDNRETGLQISVSVGRCHENSPNAMIRIEEPHDNNYKKNVITHSLSAAQLQEFMSVLRTA